MPHPVLIISQPGGVSINGGTAILRTLV